MGGENPFNHSYSTPTSSPSSGSRESAGNWNHAIKIGILRKISERHPGQSVPTPQRWACRNGPPSSCRFLERKDIILSRAGDPHWCRERTWIRPWERLLWSSSRAGSGAAGSPCSRKSGWQCCWWWGRAGRWPYSGPGRWSRCAPSNCPAVGSLVVATARGVWGRVGVIGQVRSHMIIAAKIVLMVEKGDGVSEELFKVSDSETYW